MRFFESRTFGRPFSMDDADSLEGGTGRYAVTTLRINPIMGMPRMRLFEQESEALAYARARARAMKRPSRSAGKSGAYYILDQQASEDLLEPTEYGDILYRVVRGTLPQGETILVFSAKGGGKWRMRKDLSIPLIDPEEERELRKDAQRRRL